MRVEDKELEGPELEREQRVESAAQEREEAPLPVLAGDEIRDVGLEHRSRVLDALQLILAREQVNLGLLYLPARETQALEALQAAVTGADSVGEFVFAEDRRSLLEQALAVLQQNVTHGEPAQVAELQSRFTELTDRVTTLRDELENLEDSQEERDEWHIAARWGYGPGGSAAPDTTDKPKPGADGDARLDGPEREQPAKVSTLAGPGPAIEKLPAPTTLGDDAEIAAAAAKHPWWKRKRG